MGAAALYAAALRLLRTSEGLPQGLRLRLGRHHSHEKGAFQLRECGKAMLSEKASGWHSHGVAAPTGSGKVLRRAFRPEMLLHSLIDSTETWSPGVTWVACQGLSS